MSVISDSNKEQFVHKDNMKVAIQKQQLGKHLQRSEEIKELSASAKEKKNLQMVMRELNKEENSIKSLKDL